MTEIFGSEGAHSDEKSYKAASLAQPQSQSKVSRYFSNHAHSKVGQNAAQEEQDCEAPTGFGRSHSGPSNQPTLTWEDDNINSPCDKDYLVDDMSSQTKQPPFFVMRMKDSRHYGNCIPFCYIRGEPMCLLGPDCSLHLTRAVQHRVVDGSTHIPQQYGTRPG